MKVINNEPYLEECLVSINTLFSKLTHLQRIYASGNKFTFATEFDSLCATAALNQLYLKEILSKEDLKIIEDKATAHLTEFTNRIYNQNQDKK